LFISVFPLQLKRQFSDFIFPKLPGKRPFVLNDTQVDSRRRGLEDYLDKVCSARVIFESNLMQDFLQIPQVSTAGGASVATKTAAVPKEKQVDLRVMLPDRSVTAVTINEYWRTPEVYQALVKKVGLSQQTAKYFGIFQRMEQDFGKSITQGYSKVESFKFGLES